jgi:MFS family permease
VPLKLTGLWRHADFVRLWTGETISVFGSMIGSLAMQFTAVLWLHAGPIEIATLAACQLAPGFFVGMVAGVWADRLHRRPILIAADLGRFVVFATIPLAAVFDLLTFAQLCAVAVLTATMTVFFAVAYEAYLPTLVERNELVEGNSKLTATASIAEFGSFSVSGWLVQLIKGPGAILVDAVSFLFSAFFVWRIRTPEPPAAPIHERQHMLREALEGMRLVAHSPVLRAFAIANAILMASTEMLGVTFLLYLVNDIGFEPRALGMIFAVGGVTSLAGAFFAGKPHWFGGLGPALVLSLFIRGAGTLFMPLASSVSFIGVALLVGNQVFTDPAWSFYEINSVSLRQAITEDRLQGRMNASMRTFDFGAMLLGTALGGAFGELLGLRETLFLAVGGTFVAGAWLAFSPVARLREMPGRVAEALAEIAVEPSPA